MFKRRAKLLAGSFLLGSLLASSAGAVHAQTTLEWITLAPANEGFSVKFPVKPAEDTDRVTMTGNSYKTRLYTVVDEGLLYMVAMQEFPSLDFGVLTSAQRLDQFMDGFKDGLNKSLGNATTKVDLQTDRDLDLNGKLGRQFKLSYGETKGLVRAFDASPRMYVLLVMSSDEKHSPVVRFFDSFEIKPAPAPVPLPVTESKPSS
jgi:hypothetical protein